LCPEGQWPAKTREAGLFHKSAFDYHPQTDTWHYPAGQTLILLSKCEQTPRTREHRVYGATTCGDCHLRANCTNAAQGRRIKRYPEDEQREALRLVMQHPQARRIFSQCKAIVEPVFSSLRSQQGLNRFRRRGLQAVKREFALHVLAHNLSRAVALLRALFTLLYAAYAASTRSRNVFRTDFLDLLARASNHINARASIGRTAEVFCDSLFTAGRIARTPQACFGP
jgi:hypothetical protein